MKKMITTTLAASLVASIATAGVSTTLDFASAYVFRGVTFNDGLVMQPGIEATGFGIPEEYGAIAVGAWANYDIDDSDGDVKSSNFSETDWYVSYSLPTWVDGLDLSIGYAEYTYGADSDKEMSFGAGYEVSGVALGVAFYQGVGGLISTSSYLEFAAGYGFEFTEDFTGSLDARMGFADQDGGESGFQDYDIGGGLAYVLNESWSIGASLTYIGQGDDEVLDDDDYDVSVVGMFSLACEM